VKKIFVLVIINFLLAACAIQPLHGNKEIMNQLSLIEIQNATSIDTLKINTALMQLFPESNDAALYMLEVKLEYDLNDNILLFNSDTIEQVLLQKVSYKLIDKATGKVMLTDNFSLQDVVNNALPLYTAYTDMETAKQNLISAAASLIYKNLISFFFPVSANR